MSPALKESIKEVLRLVVFAAVGAIVTALINYFGDVDQTTSVAIILLVLRALDKYIHKAEVQANGLLPF